MKTIATLLLCSCIVAVAADNDAVISAKPSQPAQHWAYQPVQRPAAPAVQNKSWVRSPIDALVLARMEAKGVKPSPDANRAALIRRATLDLWGLIPTPEDRKSVV